MSEKLSSATAQPSLPEFIDVGKDREVCVFGNGEFSLRLKQGEDRAHLRYLKAYEIELLRAGFNAALRSETRKPGKEAEILAAKIVVKKGEFADLFTASTAALLLATEILNIAYPNGVPTTEVK